MKLIQNGLLRRLADGAVSLLYPPVCPICDETLPLGRNGRLCDRCEGKMKPIVQPACLKCGKQLMSHVQEYCEQCSKRSFHFKRGFALYNYEDEARELILKLKYNGRKDIAEYFANCAVELHGDSLKATGAAAVIPVPIHKKRLIKRGYNQAQAVARIIADKLNLICIEDLLVRTKQTEAQKELSGMERLVNLYDAFDVDLYVLQQYKKRMTLEKVILVDDIFTTGSTIECCSLILQKYGVREVYFISVASTYNL